MKTCDIYATIVKVLLSEGVGHIRALGSKIHLDAYDSDIAVEYYDCVSDIIGSCEVQSLMEHRQHMNVNRLQHSINVSYYSFLLCKKLGLDSRAAARGGLLHDLFFYQFSDKDAPAGWHITVHPKQALKNAERLTKLSRKEREIIVKHMWPFCAFPKYAETHIVALVDKYCAMCEVGESASISLRHRRGKTPAFSEK